MYYREVGRAAVLRPIYSWGSLLDIGTSGMILDLHGRWIPSCSCRRGHKENNGGGCLIIDAFGFLIEPSFDCRQLSLSQGLGELSFVDSSASAPENWAREIHAGNLAVSEKIHTQLPRTEAVDIRCFHSTSRSSRVKQTSGLNHETSEKTARIG